MTASHDNIGFLGSDDVRALETLLGELVTEAGAGCAFVIDRAGRLMASAGDATGLDSTAFASLASADFAASHRLAALLGEEDFASLYHHGAERSMFLADLDGRAVLAILFDTATTLGMVRLKTKWLVPRVGEQLALLATRGPSGQVVQMEPDWANEAESEIDRLFTE
jgi:predicted regulator of Ras-like GTPase activity (Roadblock/LC7/MglB family)